MRPSAATCAAASPSALAVAKASPPQTPAARVSSVANTPSKARLASASARASTAASGFAASGFVAFSVTVTGRVTSVATRGNQRKTPASSAIDAAIPTAMIIRGRRLRPTSPSDWRGSSSASSSGRMRVAAAARGCSSIRRSAATTSTMLAGRRESSVPSNDITSPCKAGGMGCCGCSGGTSPSASGEPGYRGG